MQALPPPVNYDVKAGTLDRHQGIVQQHLPTNSPQHVHYNYGDLVIIAMYVFRVQGKGWMQGNDGGK